MMITPKYKIPMTMVTIYTEKLVYSTVNQLLNKNVPNFNRDRLLRHIHIKWEYPKLENDKYRYVWLESSSVLTQVIQKIDMYVN